MVRHRPPRSRRPGSAGETCIYCLETKGPEQFTKVEHVLPQSFGRFRPANLVLRGVVCDSCNQCFGDELELYLARDTPDGLNRFLLAGKDPAAFRSLGRRSSLVHRADDGPLKGALVAHREGEGLLELKPLPQVAYGKTDGGPYEKWFPVDQLPDRAVLEELRREGFRYVYFCEIEDIQPVLAELRERGQEVSDLAETSNAGLKQTVRIETVARLAMPFGRAITKIAFNYLAHEYGAQTALQAGFDAARNFVRSGGRPDRRRIWRSSRPRVGNGPLGHSIAIEWNRSGTPVTATATLSFHHASWYSVELGSLLVAPPADRAHLFNLKTMTVERLA